MKPIFVILPAAALLLSGCASYETTVGENEPHGVVRFVRAEEFSSDQRTVEKLDGLPVRLKREYRVSPGSHEVVVRVTEISVNSYKPVVTSLVGNGSVAVNRSATVNVPASGQQAWVTDAPPFGDYAGPQPVNLNVESREWRMVTNVLTVEAGWHYEFDGYETTRTHLFK